MKKTWEQFYEKRGRFYLLPHPQFGKVISRFKTYRAQKVLDLGCGSGRHSIVLAQEDFQVTGIDYSVKALKLAKKWAKVEKKKIVFKKGNIHKKLPFRDNTFDAVLAIDSIHYDTTEAIDFTLEEASRVLKSGGVIFVTLPTQIGNPLVTHLIFDKEEIKEIVSKKFKILDTFMDKAKYLCVFGVKN
jgi:ubiquinone/menaquinone biosynthesis C-methylase UbiE